MNGEDLTPDLVLAAYPQGWFPMEDEDAGTVDWYAPYERALFPMEGVHVSRSLARRIRRGGFEVRFDTAFGDVMEACRRPGDNWIGPNILRCYGEIHRLGWAHSVEVWRGGRLVGGLYGVAIGGCFSAESMFHRETDMSKVALWAAVERCRTLGFRIFDAQVMNPHLESMGAFAMPHAAYLRRWRSAARTTTEWSVTVVSAGRF